MNPVKEFVRRRVAAAFATALVRRSTPLPEIDGVLLVVAPHPDDETLGCGGLIARQAHAGRRVHVLFVTDGEAGVPGISPSVLAERRRNEALQALAALGVPNPASAATFLGAPDGRLDRLSPDEASALRAVLARWIQADRPEAIAVTWNGDGSTEHHGVATAVERAAATVGGALLLEYPVWAWWNAFRLRPRLRRGADNVGLRLGPLADVKRAALQCYATQIRPLPPGREPPLPASVASACCGRHEVFFRRRIPAE